MSQESPIIGWRKIIGFVVVATCGTVLQALGKFDAASAIFLTGIYTAYVGGNVFEHRAQARNGTIVPMVFGRPAGGFTAEATAPRNITPAMMKAIQSGMTADDIENLVRDVAGSR